MLSRPASLSPTPTSCISTKFSFISTNILPCCCVYSAEIRKAYHLKARQNHPDRNLSDSQVSGVSTLCIRNLSALFYFFCSVCYYSLRVVQMCKVGVRHAIVTHKSDLSKGDS